jgi:hypothetical protein
MARPPATRVSPSSPRAKLVGARRVLNFRLGSSYASWYFINASPAPRQGTQMDKGTHASERGAEEDIPTKLQKGIQSG